MKAKPIKESEYAVFLWGTLIKAMAGFESELSGETDGLSPHHLRAKSNNVLKFSLLNGICCTYAEHQGFHNVGSNWELEEKVKKIKGEKIFESLQLLKYSKEIVKPRDVIPELLRDLHKHREAIQSYYDAKDYKNRKIIKLYKQLFKDLS